MERRTEVLEGDSPFLSLSLSLSAARLSCAQLRFILSLFFSGTMLRDLLYLVFVLISGVP